MILEEFEIERTVVHPVDGNFKIPSSHPSRGKKITTLLVGFFSVFLIGFSFLGLQYLKSQLWTSWESSLTQAKWLVLAKGDQIALDEIGRFLTQLEGVKDVSFVPADEIFNDMKKDSTLAQNIPELSELRLPSAWRVSWSAEVLQSTQLETLMSDIRLFPGVEDLAVDDRMMEQARQIHLHWLQVKTLLAFLLFFAVILTSLIAGRFLFFTPLGRTDWKQLKFFVLQDGLAWAVAYGLIYLMLAPLSPALLAGGLIVGLLHFVWVAPLKANEA